MRSSITYGFIGCGNMGGAIIKGMLSSGFASKEQIIATTSHKDHIATRSQALGINVTTDNAAVLSDSDVVILAIKPYQFEAVLRPIHSLAKPGQIIISLAAGVSLSYMEREFFPKQKLLRAMPNTPVQVLEGMTSLSPNQLVTDADLHLAKTLFESCGKCEVVPESLIETVIGVSGSSPAYIYMVIEAMADAAVSDGMPRAQAYTFASQAVLGAAKMVIETGIHPGQLKDNVCSPGGTTIAAVAKLEETGLRNSIISSQKTCVQRAKDMLE